MSVLPSHDIGETISSGAATAGMVAKLRACQQALANGVENVVIVDGRDGAALAAAIGGSTPVDATTVVAGCTR